MAKKNDTTFLENKLLDFVTAKDPMLEMLQWVMGKFMEIEVAHKIGAEKGIIQKFFSVPSNCLFTSVMFCCSPCKGLHSTNYHLHKFKLLLIQVIQL